MDFTLATLLIVAAAVMLLAKYGGIHIRHQPASPALVPENSSEVLRLEYARLNRAYRCFAFLGLVTLPFGIAALLDEFHLINFDAIVGVRLEGWTIFLGIPGMLCATIYGIRQTVGFRHPALVVLSVVSIIFWGGTMIYFRYFDYVTGYVRVVVHHGQAALQKQGEWTDREREGSQVNGLAGSHPRPAKSTAKSSHRKER